ncbi:MobQ family relaxase [Methylobacterium radiotolerans]|uniref:MobQ family relaxase n=1 Tax=Methylobacterium radiotolerans TaxID=31998 RepID=UPI0015F5CF30|nr:MobQ family relaxase [Methylobacterium radiotolerans]
MAIYRLEAKIVGRSRGHSATAAAAYRARTRIVDERTGLVHDYTRRGGVEHTEILTPPQAPTWMRKDRARLWNLVEATETRANSQLARELILTLPRELSDEQRIAVVRDFVDTELVSSLGMVADIAHHTGRIDANGLVAQPHCHVLLSLREVGSDGFSRHKARAWNSVDLLERWRAIWAVYLNEALKQADIKCAPLDHRSLAEQQAEAQERAEAARAAEDETQAVEWDLTAYALDHSPEPKLGRAGHLAKRGIPSEQAELVGALRADRAKRHSHVMSLRARIAQATQDLGDRLRSALTPAALDTLRAASAVIGARRVQKGDGASLTPHELELAQAHQSELRSARVARWLARRKQLRRERQRQRGRGIGR